MMNGPDNINERIEGNGLIVLHNARLDADISVRLSELAKKSDIPVVGSGEKGEKGDTGDTGPVGPQGPQGDQGKISKSILIEDPMSGDQFVVFYTSQELKTESVYYVLNGGTAPTLTVVLGYKSDIASKTINQIHTTAEISSTTTGTRISTVNNVPAGNWVIIVLSGVSGSPESLTCTMEYEAKNDK